jgi:hypothetical protein
MGERGHSARSGRHVAERLGGREVSAAVSAQRIQPAIDSRQNAVNSEQNARAPVACELAVLQCPAISP